MHVVDDGDGPRQLSAATARARCEAIDLRAESDPRRAAMRAIERDMATALDLAREPLVAERLFVLGPERHVWYQRVHHLVIDGFGTALLTRRIADLYNRRTGQAAHRAVPPPLGDPAAVRSHDAAYRTSAKRDADRAFWHERFADRPTVASLAAGVPSTAHTYLRVAVDLPVDVESAVRSLAEAASVPWPDVLVALTAAYVRRHTRTPDVVLGVPTMERMGSPAARVPAMVMNVLPIRLAPDEDAPVADAVATAASHLRLARRHGRYRSECLRRDLGLVGGERRLHGPLVNVLPFDDVPTFGPARSTLHVLGTGPVDDLTITFRASGAAQGLRLELDANPQIYDRAVLDAHAARIGAFLASAARAARLSDVPTVTPEEHQRLVHDVNATAHAVRDTTLTALIEETLLRRADAPALEFGGRTLSYRELERLTRALAARLRETGVGRDDVVAVAMPRSLEQVVSLVAILRAGAAYLPIDIDHPAERIRVTLDLARPAAVLATDASAAAVHGARAVVVDIDDLEASPPEAIARVHEIDPGDRAYVIFTSGSTGTPKGVVIEHRAIVNRLEWMRTHYAFGEDDRILQKTPATFDVSVWEFFLSFVTGGTLVVAPPEAHKDPAWLARLIRDARITTLHFVPSMLGAFLAEPEARGLVVRRVFCSGEALPASMRDRFHEVVEAELHNLYGPTEAAVDVTWWNASRGDVSSPIPIGVPVWNTQMYVLDERLRPLPEGVAGDLYIAGVQLAREYLGRPDLTAERFVPSPFGAPAARMYRTGDIAMRRPDGAIVYLGRSDHQVKIRGLRVELGDIEAAIASSGLTSAAAVLAREDRPGDQRLVAYVVAATPPFDGAATEALRSHVAARVPDYMVPSVFVPMDALPVSSSGKLQRDALPAPPLTATTQGRPASTPTERRVSAIFARVLDLPSEPGADADFFELGGHSLLATEAMRLIRAEWHSELGLGVLFAAPTVARLAAEIDAARQPGAGASASVAASQRGLTPVVRLSQGDGAPLFCVHPAGGIAWCYAGLARAIDRRHPLIGLQADGLDPSASMPRSLTDMAARYVERAVQEWDGPYHLLGWSVGGLIAHEMAVQLQARGAAVRFLGVLDAYPADRWRSEAPPDESIALRALLLVAGQDPDTFEGGALTRDRVVAFLERSGHPLGVLPDRTLDGVVRVVGHNSRLVREHHHRRFDGRLHHFRASLDHAGFDLSPLEWAPYASAVTVHDVPALHAHMTGSTAAEHVAPIIDREWR